MREQVERNVGLGLDIVARTDGNGMKAAVEGRELLLRVRARDDSQERRG